MTGNVVPLPGIDPLALLQQMVAAAGGEVELTTADLPEPPNGSTPRAQTTWYAVLKEYGDLGIARMQMLEAVVDVISQYDRVKTAWEAAGSEITAKGSMGQEVEAPALGTMQKLRAQEAALWKHLDLAGGGAKRRPGRPTRQQSAAMGKPSQWGK